MIKKFLKWFNRNPMQEKWDKRESPLVLVKFEFANGETRELTGKAADNWWYDLYKEGCGQRVNWSKHKFNIQKKL